LNEKDPLTEKVIGYAIEVHKQLGPGLLESAYQKCLGYELQQAGLNFESEKALPVLYKELELDCGYRIDLLIEGKLILELKAVESLNNIHRAQILTYMKLSKAETGLLINFNVLRLVDGIQRFKL
jgi:GxxExxY protein